MKSYEEALSQKNKYYVEKERYLELLHHCRQYSIWVRKAHDILTEIHNVNELCVNNKEISKPVENKICLRENYLSKISMVDSICNLACPIASDYLLICITGGYSYDSLEARYGTLPISRREFYDNYRKFFWLIDKKLN